MKTWIRSTLYVGAAALVLGAVVVGLAIAGCRQTLYPLARAFGSPPESELALCRAAFLKLQGQFPHSRVRLEPVYFAAYGSRHWRYDLAENLAHEAARHTSAQFALAPIRPEIDPTHLGHNQMAYFWERAAIYGNWIKSAPPGADYVWFVEIFGQGTNVAGIQLYVFDAHGQLAYGRLFNSHHFGPNLPLDSDDVVRLIIEHLFKDLTREPTQIFPPYGVG